MNNEIKTCVKCNVQMDLSNFYVRKYKDKYKTVNKCKKCLEREKYELLIKRKKEAIKAKGGKCEICQEEYHHSVYDFHHTNPSEKEMCWRQMSSASEDKRKKELDKCMLLCSNCHRKLHWEINNGRPALASENVVEQKVKKSKNKCKTCGIEVSQKAINCKACHHKGREKIEWPQKENLIELIENNSYSELERILGVSAAAIKKRLRRGDKS